MPKSSAATPEARLESFLVKFSPEVAGTARDVLGRMRAKLPTAVQLVYDNYNALAIGFGPNERASDGIFSIAVYPRWVSLFFLQGAGLADPHGRLRGAGTQARHVVLQSAEQLDDPEIAALMTSALRSARVPLQRDGAGALVIKSVSAKQRPRRPSA